MKKQNVILLSSLAIITIALTTAFFGRGIDSLSIKHSAKADNSITIDSETLSQATYEPFEVTAMEKDKKNGSNTTDIIAFFMLLWNNRKRIILNCFYGGVL